MASILNIAIFLTLVATFSLAFDEVIITEVEVSEDNTDKHAFDGPSGKLVTKCSGGDCLGRKEFKKFCDSVIGLVDGGRCFFNGATGGLTWSKGWAVCKSKGGTMAQIHTSSENNKMKSAMLMAGGSENHFIAMRNQPNLQNTKSAVDMDLSFWYENENYFNPRLTVRNTYMSTRLLESYFMPNWDCAVVWAQFRAIGSNVCDEVKNGVVCMKTTAAQAFEFVPDACMSSIPIETINGISADDCAQACANKASWCRSFNHLNNNVCDLFSWVIVDQPQSQQKSVSDGCLHYTYVK